MLIQIEEVPLFLIAKYVVLAHLTLQVKVLIASHAMLVVTIHIQGDLLACFVLQAHITHIQKVSQIHPVYLAREDHGLYQARNIVILALKVHTFKMAQNFAFNVLRIHTQMCKVQLNAQIVLK